MGGGLKSNDFCLSSVARRGGWPGTGTHKVAAAFEAAAALISIGKSCGLQDLRPIVDAAVPWSCVLCRRTMLRRHLKKEGD